ncbi:MAG: hypothetical protein IPK71_15830 [Myxococcales bacterium]|nr:hypothetical protein [Myxococcales bacterium]
MRGSSAWFVGSGALVAFVISCGPTKEVKGPRPFERCEEPSSNGVPSKNDETMVLLRPALRACFQEALREDPQTQGCIVLSLTVRDGEVRESFVEKVHGLDASLTECVRKVVAGATFDPAGGRLVVPVTFLQQRPSAPSP